MYHLRLAWHLYVSPNTFIYIREHIYMYHLRLRLVWRPTGSVSLSLESRERERMCSLFLSLEKALCPSEHIYTKCVLRYI
jgi:hypothetical protein